MGKCKYSHEFLACVVNERTWDDWNKERIEEIMKKAFRKHLKKAEPSQLLTNLAIPIQLSWAGNLIFFLSSLGTRTYLPRIYIYIYIYIAWYKRVRLHLRMHGFSFPIGYGVNV